MEMTKIKSYPAHGLKTITRDINFRGSFGTEAPRIVQKTVLKLEKPGNRQKQIHAKQSLQKSKFSRQDSPQK
jgi:hypothetical protein